MHYIITLNNVSITFTLDSFISTTVLIRFENLENHYNVLANIVI